MTLYLSGAGAYCAFLLFSKFSDQECSKTDPVSWIVIAVASVFWFLVVPISLIELKSKAKSQKQLDEMATSRNSEVFAQRMDIVGQTNEFDSNTLTQLNPQ